VSEAGAYYSFLLRMWQVPAYEDFTWRILLENIHTGEKSGFSNLEELLVFLGELPNSTNVNSGEGSQSEVQG
jgi:hypothetical protein